MIYVLIVRSKGGQTPFDRNKEEKALTHFAANGSAPVQEFRGDRDH